MKGPALITGGAGFLGSRLAMKLHEAGIETHIIDIASRPASLPGDIHYHHGSLLDPGTLAPLVARAGTIFHMAAVATLWQRDRDVYDRINHQGTARLLDAIRMADSKARLVLTSTALILRGQGDPATTPVRISDPMPPLDAMPGPYSRSKWRADALVRQAMAEGLDAVILYPTVPIGIAAHHVTEPTEMIRRFIQTPPPAFLDTSLNLVDADDAAFAHLLAARRARTGERFLLAGEDIAFSDLLALLSKLSGRPMPRRRVPYAIAAAAAHIGESLSRFTGRPPAASIEGVRAARWGRLYDSLDIRNRLGWSPRPASDTLAVMTASLIRGESAGSRP